MAKAIRERPRGDPLFKMTTDLVEWLESEVDARGFDNNQDEMNILANFLSTYCLEHYDDALAAVRAVTAAAEKVVQFNLKMQ